MRWWLLLAWMLSGCTLSFAQVHQQTYGNSSPILNISGASANISISAPVQITNNIFAAIRALEATDDKDLKKVREHLQKGQFIEARALLEAYTAKQRKSFQNIALAKFSDAQILIAEEEIAKAAEALTVALVLEPGNCQYRAMTGFFYVSTGRFDEAKGILYASPFANECVLNGEPREAAMLYLARVRLAAELRREADAFREMQMASTVLRSMRDLKARGDFGVRCLFMDLARGYWNRKAAELWPDAEAACKQEMLSELPGSSPTAVDVFEFYKVHNSPQESLAIGDTLFTRYRNFDDQTLLGVDRLRKRALFAQIKSDHGFRVLWERGDPPAAARFYAEAYEVMAPLIASGRPSVLISFAQLVIRIKHLEEITTARVFPNTPQKVLSELERAVDSVRARGSVDSCDAMARIRGAGSKFLPESQLNELWTRQVACLAAAAPEGSFSNLRMRYTWWDNDGKPTIEGLNVRIALAERLDGFPVVENLHGKHAFDLAMRADLSLLTKGEVDDESLAKNRKEIALAIDEALIDPRSNTARLVLSRWLVSLPSTDKTTRAMKVLLNEPEKYGSNISPYGQCLSQAQRLQELDTVGVVSALVKDDGIKGQALTLLKAVAAPGNLCSAVPSEHSMGGVETTAAVERVLNQLQLIHQIEEMRNASKLNEEFTKSPLIQQCLASRVRIELPLCMFYLPKGAKRNAS